MTSESGWSVASKLLRSNWFRGILIAVILAISLSTTLAAVVGVFEEAGQLATVASALATILLVSLTADYVQMTQRLAEEAKSDREQRKETHENEQERELMALRRGLLKEIGQIETYDDYVEEYEIGLSVFEIPAPKTVYEQNADRIGLLEDEEIDAIVEYYTRLDHIQTEIETQRRLDTPDEWGLFKETYENIGSLVDAVVRMLSLGRFGQRASKKRQERIRRLFDELTTAQDAAIDAIEGNLQTDYLSTDE